VQDDRGGAEVPVDRRDQVGESAQRARLAPRERRVEAGEQVGERARLDQPPRGHGDGGWRARTRRGAPPRPRPTRRRAARGRTGTTGSPRRPPTGRSA
jgi:hypothetical protein